MPTLKESSMFGGPGTLLLSSSSSCPLASSSSLPGFQNKVGPMLWFWSSKDPALARSSISPNISTPTPQCLAKSYSARQPYLKPRPSVSRFSPTCAEKSGLGVNRSFPVAELDDRAELDLVGFATACGKA